eukprot:COSAG06_NODE_54270_length_295_cov_1.056122_1_plen_98_part_11
MFRACVNATSILGTLSAAAEASASDDSEAGTVASTAFSYLPEFYLDSMIDAFETLALRRLGEETTLPLTDPEHRPGLETIINFLASHFNSRSIINSDM